MVEILEIIGMIFSIIGALLMSVNAKREDFILLAYYMFFIADIALFFMGIYLGMIALLIQVVFFTLSAINGISKIKNNMIITKLLFIIFGISVISGVFLAGKIKNEMILNISNVEIIAATLAILGSFILAYKDLRLYAFMLFFIADSFYIYISFEKHLLYFGVQSAFFLLTSLKGINSLKKL